MGFSGAVGAEDALGSHVLEFENSLVAAAEGSCDVCAKSVHSAISIASHTIHVHALSRLASAFVGVAVGGGVGVSVGACGFGSFW